MAKKRKKIIIIVAAVVVVALAAAAVIVVKNIDKEEAVEYETKTAEKVTMVETITAAGEVQTTDKETIEFSTSKTFRAMCVEEEELVKKGQHLIAYSNGTFEVAPADGFIIDINAPETGTTATSSNLITFGRTGKLQLDITIPEDQINEISKGDTAVITVNSDTSKQYEGKIVKKKEMSTTLISEKASSDSSSISSGSMSGMSAGGSSSGKSDPFGSESSTAYYTVSIKFKNDGTVQPGMSASSVITISEREDVLSVPVEAVYFDNEGKAYVLTGTIRNPEKTKVETGESDANNVEITKGLKEGQSIIVEKQK